MLTWDDEVTTTSGSSGEYRVLKRVSRKFPPAKGETTLTSTTGVVGAETDGEGNDGDGDGGDGDGDPDSDRRKLARQSISAASAPVQSATSIRILRMPAVQVRIGLSRSTIYEAISKSEFPPSISLGARAVGWLESDIDAWLESRILASKTPSVAELRQARVHEASTQSAKLSQE